MSKRMQIGASRSREEIKADPLALPQEIARLSETEQIAHPNCPEALWWALAVKHPLEAEASSLYALLTLESPERWVQLENDNMGKWIGREASDWLLFGVDCAEHVLPYFEKAHPTDKRPRRAIAAARAYIGRGRLAISEEKLKAAERAAMAALAKAKTDAANFAVRAAIDAVRGNPNGAWYEAVHAVRVPGAAVGKSNHAYTAEKRWQWGRLKQYLRGEVAMPYQPDKVGARSHKAIQSDPMATPAQILAMSKKKPLDALAHPNCPIDLWWKLAEQHPIEAESSVLFEMFTLEDPARWTDMVAANKGNWIAIYVRTLPDALHRLLAADLAEHVLPFYEETRKPVDHSVRRALRVANAFAMGDASESDLEDANQDCRRAMMAATVRDLGVHDDAMAAVHAAEAAVCATEKSLFGNPSARVRKVAATAAAYQALLAARHHARFHDYRANGDAVELKERDWQWEQVKKYVKSMLPVPSQPTKVGGRNYKSVSKDPQADAAIIRKMARKQPRKAIAHPNCPVELWWELAARFPLDALVSPAYGLMTLETPETWHALEAQRADSWIRGYASHPPLSENDLRLFAVDCAMRVLPLYERMFPTDTRPRHAIDMAKAYAQGGITKDALGTAYLAADAAVIAAMTAYHQTEGSIDNRARLATSAAASAANAAAHAASPAAQVIKAAAEEATTAVYEAAGRKTPAHAGAVTGNVAEQTERVWQWHRLVEYLQPKTEVAGRRRRWEAKPYRYVNSDRGSSDEEMIQFQAREQRRGEPDIRSRRKEEYEEEMQRLVRIASNPRSTPDELRKAAFNMASSVPSYYIIKIRCLVARNPNTSLQTLKHLSKWYRPISQKTEHAAIRAAIRKNPAREMLLLEDPSLKDVIGAVEEDPYWLQEASDPNVSAAQVSAFLGARMHVGQGVKFARYWVELRQNPALPLLLLEDPELVNLIAKVKKDFAIESRPTPFSILRHASVRCEDLIMMKAQKAPVSEIQETQDEILCAMTALLQWGKRYGKWKNNYGNILTTKIEKLLTQYDPQWKKKGLALAKNQPLLLPRMFMKVCGQVDLPMDDPQLQNIVGAKKKIYIPTPTGNEPLLDLRSTLRHGDAEEGEDRTREDDEVLNQKYGIFPGKHVQWAGVPGSVMKIDASLVLPSKNNKFYANQLANYYQAVKRGAILEAPVARVEIVTKSDVKAYQLEYEEGHLFRPLNKNDLGKPMAVLTDGNHRAFAAILAGEPWIYVHVLPLYRQDMKKYLEGGQ